MSASIEFLGKQIEIEIDRPLGSRHPEHNLIYRLNYGFVPGVLSGDGEPLDAYLLNVKTPVRRALGRCVAVVRRLDEEDDKLVIVPLDAPDPTDGEIEAAVGFQERYFRHEIVRKRPFGLEHLA